VDALGRSGNAVSFLDASAAEDAPHDLGTKAFKHSVHMEDLGRSDRPSARQNRGRPPLREARARLRAP
jgi:hypothetical protein